MKNILPLMLGILLITSVVFNIYQYISCSQQKLSEVLTDMRTASSELNNAVDKFIIAYQQGEQYSIEDFNKEINKARLALDNMKNGIDSQQEQLVYFQFSTLYESQLKLMNVLIEMNQ